MAIRIGELQAIVMVFALVGIIGMIALYVMASVYGQIPTSALSGTAGTYINNSYTNSTSSISTLISWLPIIGIVVAAAIVLGLLIFDMFSQKGTVSQ